MARDGGGCLAVDVRDTGEIRNGIARLSQDAKLREELLGPGGFTEDHDVGDYALHFSDLLTACSNPLDRLGSIYFWVDDTATREHNSGIQRVTRQLAGALMSSGARLMAVKWDRTKECFLCSERSRAGAYRTMERTGRRCMAPMVEPARALHPAGYWYRNCRTAPSPMSCGSQVHADPVRRHILRCDSLELRDSFPSEFADEHHRYMKLIGQFDRVFPISQWSCNNLMEVLLSDRARLHSADHRIQRFRCRWSFRKPRDALCQSRATNQ